MAVHFAPRSISPVLFPTFDVATRVSVLLALRGTSPVSLNFPCALGSVFSSFYRPSSPGPQGSSGCVEKGTFSETSQFRPLFRSGFFAVNFAFLAAPPAPSAIPDVLIRLEFFLASF